MGLPLAASRISSSDNAIPDDLRSRLPLRAVGWGIFLGATTIALTWSAWKDIFTTAIHDEESGYILLVPVIVVWLAWVRRRQFAMTGASRRWVGPILMAIGWAAWSYGMRSNKHTAIDGGAIMLLIGSVVCVVGADSLMRLWPAVAALFFLIPVWPERRQQLAAPLQLATAKATEAVCQALGMMVVRQGRNLVSNGVDIGIAEACNGMRMALTLPLVCYAYAFITPLKSWVRILILGLSPVIAIVCNIIRLVPTVWIKGHASEATAERFHDISGWVMLLIAFLLAMGIVKLLQWLMVNVVAKQEEHPTPMPVPGDARHSGHSSCQWLAPAMLGCVPLIGIGMERLTFLPPSDNAAYHQHVREAASEFPRSIGQWIGQDIPVPYDVVGRLQPNVLICRQYQNLADGRRASVLLAQCRDARDLAGHYPPRCYPNEGFEELAAEPRDWQVEGLIVHGMQYEFVRPNSSPRTAMAIANFIVMPGGRTERDISAVEAAGDDVGARYYGAAEVQIVCDLSTSQQERDEIARTFIAASRATIDAMAAGPVK